jgi:hypothetical protein
LAPSPAPFPHLNNATLWLRNADDVNIGLRWSSQFDGPFLFGEGGGGLGITGTNGTTTVLTWNSSNQVGIGTTSPEARLDLGGDAGNPKLVLVSEGGGFIGPSIGANSSQLIFNLPTEGGDRFSFMASPGGVEMVSILDNSAGFPRVGIGTATPARTLDVRGGVKFGSSGQYYAPGAIDDLYIIRGVVSSTGSIIAGTGFTVTKGATGFFTVNFNPAFSGMPAVVVTPQSGIGRIATCTSMSASSTGIWTRDNTATPTDNQFDFIAIGPK